MCKHFFSEEVHVPSVGCNFHLRQIFNSRCVSLISDYYTTVAPRFLRHVRTKVVEQDACREMYAYKTYIKDTMICAGYIGGGMDACKVFLPSVVINQPHCCRCLQPFQIQTVINTLKPLKNKNCCNNLHEILLEITARCYALSVP